MIVAPSPALPPPCCWATNDPVGEVPATPPLRERFNYQNPRQRQRPPFHQKRPEKEKQKPDDEHTVDDYA